MDPIAPAPEATRKPQSKLSDADKEQIRQTLARADVKYNISLCAELLDLNYGAVESFVRRDPWLSAQCPEKNPENMVPGETSIIDRVNLPDPALTTLTPQEFEQYQGFIRQNKRMLAKDWEALGIDAKKAKKMEGYAHLGSAPIGQVIRLSHGQLIKNMGLLDEVIQGDADKILAGNLPVEKNKDGTERDPETVQREWRHTLYAGMKLQLDMFTHMNKIQAMMARAMKDMQDAMRRGDKPGKGKLAESAIQRVQRADPDAAPN